jgi:hypothetical protein
MLSRKNPLTVKMVASLDMVASADLEPDAENFFDE